MIFDAFEVPPPRSTMHESQLARGNRKDARCWLDGTTSMGLARLKRTSTSFAVFCMRVFGL